MPSHRSSRTLVRPRRSERGPEPVPDDGPPVDPKERTIVWLLFGAAASAAWVVGGMWSYALIAPAVFSALALIWALLPRSFFPDYQPGRQLVRFPIFWLGLAFLLWGAVHVLNPATRAVVNFEKGFWYMEKLSPVTWLPSGVEAPFRLMSGWRLLAIHAIAWVAVCAAWVGLTRRRSTRLLLTALVLNAVVIGLVGIAQRLSGTNDILWLVPNRIGSAIFGTFTYRNQAGAYLNLMAAGAFALAFWHARRAERLHLRSSPAVIFGLAGGALLSASILSYSRGAAIIACVTALGAALIFVTVQVRRHRAGPAVAAAGALAVLMGYGAYTLGATRVLDRFQGVDGAKAELVDGARAQVTAATFDMARAKLWTGWGPGAFQYHFPPYQKNYPEIYGANWESRKFWEFAHNDWAQTLAEQGIVGVLLLLAAGGFWAYRLGVKGNWRSAWLIAAIGGGLLVMVHAWFDFHFYNPAILIAWCLLWPLFVRWREWER